MQPLKAVVPAVLRKTAFRHIKHIKQCSERQENK